MDFTINNPPFPESFISYGMMIYFACLLIGFIAIMDILTKNFKDKQDRLFWLVAVILTFGFAGIFYLFQRRKL